MVSRSVNQSSIAESKDLSSMSLATLFGKLQEHEMELQRLNQNEENDKKKRSIDLKASYSIQEENKEEDSDDEEDFSFFVKKFQKFIKKRRKEELTDVRISIMEENHKMILKSLGVTNATKLVTSSSIVLQMKNGRRKVKRKLHIYRHKQIF